MYYTMNVIIDPVAFWAHILGESAGFKGDSEVILACVSQPFDMKVKSKASRAKTDPCG
jgi:hypothetical protein